MYIDAHTHLNTAKLFWNWQEYLSDFEKIWWEILINSWADDEYNKNWLIISKEYLKNNNKDISWKCIVKATIWFHPYEAISDVITEENLENNITKLRNLYLENKEHIVAIWECGIDTHYDGDLKMDLQKKLFIAQLDLSRELDLPVVIHSREDFWTTFEILKKYSDLNIYIHCRWYWVDEIKIMQDTFENLWIWFDGNITYPKAQNLRDSLKAVKLDNLLLETDAPYLTPQIKRWETNYPAYVKYIYDFVSDHLDIEQEKMANIIKKNCKNLYSL